MAPSACDLRHHRVHDAVSGNCITVAAARRGCVHRFNARKRADNRAPDRLLVRRIPDFNTEAHSATGQDAPFHVRSFHAFFISADRAVLYTVAAARPTAITR